MITLVRCSSSDLVKCCQIFEIYYSYLVWTQRYNLLFTPFPKPRPRSERRRSLAESVRCRHRSERPFISSLGRWTPHLISNKGDFSILQPVYRDTATNLGLYYFDLPGRFFLLFWKILLTLTGLCFTFSLWTFSLCRERETRAKSFAFNKEACGSLFVFWISWVSLLERKAWERNCPRQPERLRPWLKSPERQQLHLPRPMDR